MGEGGWVSDSGPPAKAPTHPQALLQAPEIASTPDSCPGAKTRRCVPGRRGWAGAEATYGAEPTLLSLFPSPLTGFVSSTSCCSSVIRAAAGTAPSAPGSPRLPESRAPLRAAPSPTRCAHPGWPGAPGAANLDTLEAARLAGANAHRPAGKEGRRRREGGREGAGRSEVTASSANQGGPGIGDANLLNESFWERELIGRTGETFA